MPVVGNRSPLRYMTMMTSSCLHSSPARVLTLPLISPAGERVKIPSTVLSHPSCSVYWFPTFASASLFIPHGQAVNFFVHVARGARALGMERPSALSPKSPRRSTLDPRPSTLDPRLPRLTSPTPHSGWQVALACLFASIPSSSMPFPSSLSPRLSRFVRSWSTPSFIPL